MRCSLKKFIEENEIDIKEASDKTGVSVSVISRVMRGTIPASAKTKSKFKEVYDLDIIEISHGVLKQKETKEEISNMKQEIKELKQGYKADIKILTNQYQNEKAGLFNQIKELQKQIDIKDMRLSLTKILSQNDSFFARPDVIRTIRKLMSMVEGNIDDLESKEHIDEIVEDNKLELDQIEECVEKVDEVVEEDEESSKEIVESIEPVEQIEEIKDSVVVESNPIEEFTEDLNNQDSLDEDEDIEDLDDEIENDNNGLDIDSVDEAESENYEYPEDVEIEEPLESYPEFNPEDYPNEEPENYEEDVEEFLDDSEVQKMDEFLNDEYFDD